MEEDEKPIRVVDRRMFTPDGELRSDFEPEEAPAPAAPAPASASGAPPEAARAEKAGREAEAAMEGDFLSMVRSLATTAYAALGLIPDPATGDRHRDPGVARQMIDWLGILEQKTRGNLSFEESDLLSRVLYELRLSYVEVSRSAGK